MITKNYMALKTAKNDLSSVATSWIDEQLEKKRGQFAHTNRVQLVSFREWCQEWEWARRSDVYTHLMHSYPAKLLAYIPIVFLTSSLISAKDRVMDCFAGTGTVLLECLVHQFTPRNCYGVEINPLARLIAKVKTTPLQLKQLEVLSTKLYQFIIATPKAPIPEFKNRDFWFRPAAQEDLARIRYSIETLDMSPDERDFFRVCLSAIIRDMSRADPDVAPPVLFNPEKFPPKRQAEIRRLLWKKQRANALELFKVKVLSNLRRMKDFSGRMGEIDRAKSSIVWDDACEIKMGRYVEAGKIDKTGARVLANSVGMVITSPPYMAAQKYIRTTRLELSWLGLASEDEIQQLNNSIIGAERVPFEEKRELIPVDNSTADSLLKRVYRSNPERAAIASRYFRTMRHALRSIHRALKPEGICVLVVGNNTLDGYAVPNHRLLSEIAAENNMFATDLILRDPIRSRGLITKRHDTAGVIDDEYVIILRKQAIPNAATKSNG